MKQKPVAKKENVSRFFKQDHREIAGILKGLSFDSPKKALAKFEEFDKRLEGHMHWEEEILFPAVIRKTSELEAGPIRALQGEHQRIRENTARALKALREGDGKQAKKFTEAMLRMLRDHISHEERILYPTYDDILSKEESSRDKLLDAGT